MESYSDFHHRVLTYTGVGQLLKEPIHMWGERTLLKEAELTTGRRPLAPRVSQQCLSVLVKRL